MSSFLFSAFAVLSCLSLVTSSPFTLRVAHQDRGILTLSFDPDKPANSSLQLLSTTQAGYKPGWLHAREDVLFSISRTHFPDDNSTSAGVYAFRKLSDGQLSLLDTESSKGDGGVFVDVSPDGKTLASANIDGAAVSVFPLNSDGSIGKARHVFEYTLTQPGPGSGDSQLSANPHAAVFSPDGDLMAVPDRGADRLYIYHVHGTDRVEQIRNITLLPGSGPRHLLFSRHNRTRTVMYLAGELDNTVTVFALDRPPWGCRGQKPDLNGTFSITRLQTISTLNSSSQRTEPNNRDLASELALSSDGRFLYVSNRNTVSVSNIDTLAIYAVDAHRPDQPLRFLGLNSTHGKIPRHFSLSPDRRNRFVAVANQVTNDLFVAERDWRTGFLGRVAGRVSFGDLDKTTEVGPVAVIWD